ncbi:beta-L-arabinofuranosidase domain-containing protein [Blautia sp. CLA-JM-H16]|uniref:Beta-L-arabinofuranosidase domain-containing protein n=1 Tax=Blautia aquisgranensis TaxID=3133153 RepID=A0ABV1BH70_9FIRM
MGRAANSSIDLKNIHITDSFWNKYVHLVKDVIIPYQWDILNDRLEDVETSHCIENFKIAAGESEGEFQGAVFQDTDVAKWLEAVGFALSWERDEKLEALADETIDLIGRAQQPDGYLNTYFTIKEPGLRWTNLMEGHELYTAGHMIEAAVAYYEATGKKKFLDIVSRFADLICDTFGAEEGKIHGYPGHQEIELALVKLYRVTGTRKYLELAKYFIDARGEGENYFLNEEKKPAFKRIFPDFHDYNPAYSQSHQPVRKQKTAEGHAVRANYMYSAMADLACEYEDDRLKAACENLWDNMVHKRMYITGSVGSSGILERFTTDYDLPNASNYSETCASIALAMFGKRMADMEKDASYMDAVERALYNTVLSGIAMDGKSFFYVNPLEVWPANCIPRTSMEHVKPVRQKWFGVACCPPNITRTLASLGQYVYFQEKDQIYVNLYIANETEVQIGGNPFKITLEGNFPWENNLRFTVDGECESEGMIAFRVPSYAKNFCILHNGQKVEIKTEKGYAKIAGKFSHEIFEISFEAPAVFVHANPQVRADAAKTAVVKGPLVYCLEEADNGDDLSALLIDTAQTPEEIYDDQLLGGCSVVHISGRKISGEGWNEHVLYQEKPVSLEDVKLTLVPYCYWGNRKAGEMLVWMKESL